MVFFNLSSVIMLRPQNSRGEHQCGIFIAGQGKQQAIPIPQSRALQVQACVKSLRACVQAHTYL